MRLGIDATPLLGSPTGVGRYTKGLLNCLVAQGNSAQDDTELAITATAFSSTGAAPLSSLVPDSVKVAGKKIPATVLQRSWKLTGHPTIGRLCGPVDVFHATNFVLPALGKARGALSVHDLTFLRYPETVTAATLRYRSLVPDGIRRASVVFALTNAMADEISAEYRIDRGRIVVVPPGVDDLWFLAAADAATLRELGLPTRFILAVGSLEPRKNLPVLLDAHERLRTENPATPPLVLVGPAGWGAALRLDQRPTGSVFTTGYLDDATLRTLVASATCLAFPSRYEGFGLPVIEALACGTPVVATDLPVTREVAGAQAIYVADRDVDALSAGLAAACEQPRTADDDEERRAQARQWTWQRTARTAFEGYRLALNA